MEPDLLEISGEDDSLLQQQHIPNDGVSLLNTSSTYFECSPLQIPRSKPPLPTPRSRVAPSPTVNINVDEDAGQPSSSAHNVSAEKENLSMKLNVEPQKMKKKKAYNLRKSLAWNKAFFTEEGVLDSEELSLISGNFGKSSGQMLPIIHEEVRESLSGNVENASESAYLHSLDDKLFKEELPASSVKEAKRNATLLSKHSSPARNTVASSSAAKRKVLSPHDLNKSGSKRSGCPRPISSSSVKRSVTMNSTASADKGSKVSKLPVLKQHSRMHSTSAETGKPSATQSKKNNVPLPVIAPKRAGLKGSSNIVKNIQNGSISGASSKSLIAKASVPLTRRNAVTSTSGKHSSSKSQNSLVKKTNDCLKVKPAPMLPAQGHPSSGQESCSRTPASILSQTTKSSGERINNAPPQIAKPSGLRMPSPSLGFFGQSKPSASHSQLPRSTQSCNVSKSTIPKGPKPSGPIPPTKGKSLPTAGQPLERIDLTSGNTMVAISSLQSTDLSAFSSSLNDMTKPQLHANQQKLGSTSNDFHQQAHEHTKQCSTEEVTLKEMNELQGKEVPGDDKTSLFQLRFVENLKNRVVGTSANIYLKGNDLIKTVDHNHHSTSCLTPVTLAKFSSGAGKVESSSHAQDIEKVKVTATGIDDSGREGHLHSFNANFAAERQNPTLVGTSDGNLAIESENSLAGDYHFQFHPDTQAKIASQLGKVESSSPTKEIEQVKDTGTGFDDSGGKAEAGEVQLYSSGNLVAELDNATLFRTLDGVLAVESEKSSAGDDHQSIELHIASLVEEHVFQDRHKSQSNNGLLHEQHSSVELRQEIVDQNIVSVKSRTNELCKDELEISSASCLIPVAKVDFCSDAAEMVECMYLEDARSDSLDTVKKVDQHVDTEPHLLHEKLSPVEPQRDNVLQDIMLARLEREDTCINQLKISSSTAMNDLCSDAAALAESVSMEDTQSGSLTTEKMVEIHVNDQYVDTELQSQTVSCGSERVIEETCKNELKISSATAINDFYSDAAALAENVSMEDTESGSLNTEKMVEIHVLDQYVDELQGQTESSGSERMIEDQPPRECCGEVVSNCQSSGDWREKQLENANSVSRSRVSIQVEGGLKEDDMIELEDVEDKQFDNQWATSLLQHGESNSFIKPGISEMANDWLNGTHEAGKEFMEQSKVATSSFLEAKVSHDENSSQMGLHVLFEESNSFEDSGKLNCGNTTNVRTTVNKNSCKGGLQSQHISEHEHGDTNEELEIDIVKASFVEESKLQSSVGSFLVVGFNHNTSTENDVSMRNTNEENRPQVQDGSDDCESKCSDFKELNAEVQDGGDICELECSNGPEMQDGDDVCESKYSSVTKVNPEKQHGVCEPKFSNEEEPEMQDCADACESKCSNVTLLNHETQDCSDVYEPKCCNEENSPEMLDGTNVCEPNCTNVAQLQPKMQDGGDFFEPECSNVADLNPDALDGGVSMDENTCSQVEDMRLAPLESEFDIQATSMSKNQPSEVPSIRNFEENMVNDTEGNPFEDDVLLEEAQPEISQNNGNTNSEKEPEPAKVVDTTKLLETPDKNEQKALEIKLPIHAAPYSEEWLAAIEGAGEEILTMKLGVVKHSPPEKPQAEPNPWSPVKRKNNQGIGPFDCTKHTNNIQH